MTEEPKKSTFKKIARGVRGTCPQCRRPMTIYHGINHCPSCGYIFKSNFDPK